MWTVGSRLIVAVAIGLLATACAFQRAQQAEDARAQMIGLSKEQVLSCMGIPAQKAVEGPTEVWSYNSGNGRSTTFVDSNTTAAATATVNATTTRVGPTTYGSATIDAVGSSDTSTVGITTRRYCVVNVVLNNERVSRVAYAGPTGGLLTQGEQCAFAVSNCLPTNP